MIGLVKDGMGRIGSLSDGEPESRRADFLYPLLATGIALVVYGATVTPDLTWANAATDGGELITASATLGIPHPPGYPTYVILGKLFSALPFGTVAFRYNLFSAVCAAAAVGLLAAAVRSFWRPRVSSAVAAVAALTFAFLPIVWGQAIVAEVYSLNLLILAAFLLGWSRYGGSFKTGVLLGLAMTTHLTSILMLPMALSIAGRRLTRLLAGILLGLTPLLLLPWLAQNGSPIMWGRADTPDGWLWLASGRLYSANLQFPPNPGQLVKTLSGLVLGAAGLVIGGRIETIFRLPIRSGWWTGRSVAPIVLTVALYTLLAVSYATPDAAVLMIPALMLATLVAAPVFQKLGAVALILPLILGIAGLSYLPTQANHQPRILAESTLHAAPLNAILLAPGDRTLFTLSYFHYVEENGPDIFLVDTSLFAFDWYRARLAERNPDIYVPAGDNLAAFQQWNQSSRSFCSVSLVAEPPPLPISTYPTAKRAPTLLCAEGNH